MKKLTYTLFTILLITITPITLFSQVPQKIDFQAIARDAEGIPIASQDIGVKIAIVKDSIGGEVVYEETHDTITDISGLFTLQIGNGDTISGNFLEINWGNSSYYTQVGIKLEGGANYIDMGTMEMVSVPYALYAKRSGTSYWDSVGTTIFYNEGRVGVGTNSPEHSLHVIGDAIIDGGGKALRLKNAGTNTSYMEFYKDSINPDERSGYIGFGSYVTNKLYIINEMAEGGHIILIPDNGNVGIGTVSPSSKLSVAGLPNDPGNRFLKYNTSNGAFSYSTSSKKYMSFIGDLKGEHYEILKAQPKSFTYKKGNQSDIGLLAEDLDELGLVDLVIYDENNKPDDIKYDRISLYLIEIIKDQQKRIDELESRMTEMEKSK